VERERDRETERQRDRDGTVQLTPAGGRLPVLEHVARRHDEAAGRGRGGRQGADLFTAASAFVKANAELVSSPPPPLVPAAAAADQRRRSADAAAIRRTAEAMAAPVRDARVLLRDAERFAW
jgi:hypothetical protein